jgi:hypothetical protein
MRRHSRTVSVLGLIVPAMTDLTNVATLLTAFRDLLARDMLDARSPFLKQSIEHVQEALDELIASGLVQSDQVTAYDGDGEFRIDFTHALFGSDRCAQWARTGKF